MHSTPTISIDSFGARGDGVAGDKTAAADRDDERLEIGRVLQHFQRNGALAGDDVRIVVRMHPDQIALGGDRLGPCLRFHKRLAVQHDHRAQRLGGFDFHERRRLRHDDGRRYGKAAGVIGDRLGVVAGGHCDDAAAALFGAERGKLDAGAALLERVGDLQILVLDEDLCRSAPTAAATAIAACAARGRQWCAGRLRYRQCYHRGHGPLRRRAAFPHLGWRRKLEAHHERLWTGTDRHIARRQAARL